ERRYVTVRRGAVVPARCGANGGGPAGRIVEVEARREADRLTRMSFLYNIFVLIHLLGMAALVGGYLVVLPNLRVNDVMLWGARIQLLSGVIVMGIGEAVSSLDKDYDMAKIGIKLVISVIVVALVEIARAGQSRDEAKPNLVHAAGALAIINVVIAVLWTSSTEVVDEALVESMIQLR